MTYKLTLTKPGPDGGILSGDATRLHGVIPCAAQMLKAQPYGETVALLLSLQSDLEKVDYAPWAMECADGTVFRVEAA